MAQICLLCSKGSQVGGGYQNRVRATKFQKSGLRRRYPNLQWARIPGGPRIKICTCCMKKGTHLELSLTK
jgi:ribosomal protein L28